ncbi:ABC transporter ATP-binding protein [Intrasporangium sp.]|uniref:ABC transporter ATP-binding protein n=1 Tax=Intrasporangium sp. TaxID=1925024 RepID=UPI0032215463
MAVIEVAHLRRTYGETVAVADVSFTVQEGEIFGIIGPNGAGKTTTVECLLGLRRRDAGLVSVLGLDPATDHDRITTLVGAQLQEAALPDKLSVREALELHAAFHARPIELGELVDRLGLRPVLRTRFARLSGGQRQRLSIALALVGRPRIAMLDELTTGLDPAARRETWRLVRELRDTGVTVLLVTHSMEEAERLCDRLVVIDAGRVTASGSPAQITASVAPDQTMRFVPSRPVEPADLVDLPGVRTAGRNGPEVVVSGTDGVVQSVIAELIRRDILAQRLRVEQAGLDDAFVALTSRTTAPLERKPA